VPLIPKPDKAKSPEWGIAIYREELEAIAGLQPSIDTEPIIFKNFSISYDFWTSQV